MKKEPNIFMCLGSPTHLPELLEIQSDQDTANWTIKPNAGPGDTAVFYLTMPIASIAGYGEVISDPWLDENSEWKDKYFAEIGNIRIFAETDFISNAEMRRLFPEWRWWLQPRRTGECAEDIRKPFLDLLKNNGGNL